MRSNGSCKPEWPHPGTHFNGLDELPITEWALVLLSRSHLPAVTWHSTGIVGKVILTPMAKHTDRGVTASPGCNTDERCSA